MTLPVVFRRGCDLGRAVWPGLPVPVAPVLGWWVVGTTPVVRRAVVWAGWPAGRTQLRAGVARASGRRCVAIAGVGRG
jgi:hypothetical protein